MRRLPLFAAFLLALTASASAQQPEGERLIIHPPTDWQILPKVAQGNASIVTMVPPGSSPDNYVEMLRVERYEGDKRAPKDFIFGIIDGSKKNCESVQVGNLDESPVNGYKGAYIKFACTKSARTGKSGLMMVAAVAGKDALHVAQRIWLGAPVAPNEAVPIPAATVDAWNAFAALLTVCDSRDKHHPCPKAEAPPPAKK